MLVTALMIIATGIYWYFSNKEQTMLYTKEVMRIEEETGKSIEDFCDEDYFINKYGQDYVDRHFESSDDEEDDEED